MINENLINNILKLHNEFFLDKKEYSNIFNLFKDKKYIIKNLFAKNEFIGYIIIYDNFENYDIFEIAICKKFQKKQYAKVLLDMIPKDKDIFLEVSENNKRALKVYEDYGFNKVAIRKKYYLDNSSAIIMKKSKE